MSRTVSKEERQKAFEHVFGAAVKANAKYGTRKKGQCYDQQVRKGKTKGERYGVSRSKALEMK